MIHEDREAFREALDFTAAHTGFLQRYIEKDYYCSLVLQDLFPLWAQGLVFKGGTCLSKVYLDFFRLSEDLDFCVHIPVGVTRKQRREIISPIRDHLAHISERCAWFKLQDPLMGHAEGTQYNARVAYISEVTHLADWVRVEISLREALCEPSVAIGASTILYQPSSQARALVPFEVQALSLREAIAEKMRAALTREAIRDYFDLHIAWKKGLISMKDEPLIALLSKKLDATPKFAPNLSEQKIAILKMQVQNDLQNVLKQDDFHSFDFNEILSELRIITSRLAIQDR